MNEKLKNMIRQLSSSEQKTLEDYLERQYSVEFKGDGMLRDDIVYKITVLLHMEFMHIEHAELHEKHNLQKDLNLDAVDITAFADALLKEFELEEIPFSNIMEWVTVADIVNTIEDSLECALHDMED